MVNFNKLNFRVYVFCIFTVGILLASNSYAASIAPQVSISAITQKASTTETSSLPQEMLPGAITQTTATPTDLESCFNYYTFGSVEAQVSSAYPTIYQGADVPVQGTLINHNPYPVIDATVWVKVFKQRGDPTQKDANGPDVVDIIKVANNITLKASEIKPFSFKWKIPDNAQPGKYRFATFVDGAGQFSLLGLTFTDDIIGDSFDFTVTGHDYGAVRFDKAGVKVNNQQFYFAAYPPQVDASTTDATISANITNTESKDVTASVAWNLYYWDSAVPTHLLAQKSESYLINANSSTTVSFVVKDTSHTVYYLVGELTGEKGSKSVIGVRFVRNGVTMPRLAYLAVNQYPISTDTASSTKIFACIHSTNNNDTQNATLTLSALSSGWFGTTTLATKTYSGTIPGAMSAFVFPLLTKESSFTLNADLYQDGKLVETKSVQYKCEDLQDNCLKPNYTPLITTVALALIIIFTIAHFIIKRYYPYLIDEA